jgi:hypothetical protein
MINTKKKEILDIEFQIESKEKETQAFKTKEKQFFKFITDVNDVASAKIESSDKYFQIIVNFESKIHLCRQYL